jgi:hypothetical protein
MRELELTKDDEPGIEGLVVFVWAILGSGDSEN